ncbi:cytochrome P450 [Nocardia sp. NPDC004860]|uniref:cytochrome P450 n=1 Tax=Nocardia sp. NPDC004860 TaxID=3154557 RepID=UPI0033B65C08
MTQHANSTLQPYADLTDLDVFANGFPYDEFARLREHDPVRWHPPTEFTPGGEGFWVVSRYSEVVSAARNIKTFSSSHGGPRTEGGGVLIDDLPVGLVAGVLLNMTDDPRHMHVRKLLSPPFAPRVLAGHENELAARAKSIVAGAIRKGECEFLQDVAAELPLQATAMLLGVPQEDRHKLLEWTVASLDHVDRDPGGTSPSLQKSMDEMYHYSVDLLNSKRKCPADDVLSLAVHGKVPGPDGIPAPLTELETQTLFSLLIAAGAETTRNSIALGMQALIDRPQLWHELRSDRGLLSGAVDEMLRFTSVSTYNRRTATCDTELGGVRIAAGDKVTLWWASANRDPAVFSDPDNFDIRRNPNPHVTFGLGGHFCMGAAFARMLMRLVFNELLDHVAEPIGTGPLEYSRSNKHVGVRRMPVRLQAT